MTELLFLVELSLLTQSLHILDIFDENCAMVIVQNVVTYIEGTWLVSHLHSLSISMVSELLAIALGYSKLWQLTDNI